MEGVKAAKAAATDVDADVPVETSLAREAKGPAAKVEAKPTTKQARQGKPPTDTQPSCDVEDTRKRPRSPVLDEEALLKRLAQEVVDQVNKVLSGDTRP